MHPISRRSFHHNVMCQAMVVSALSASLSACGGKPIEEPEAKTLAWTPIRLSVSDILITDRSTIDPGADFVSKRRVDELRVAAKDYLGKRFVAAGGNVRALASLEEVRLIERPLETQGGISGFFTSEADAELEGQLTVRMTIVDALGLDQGFAQARVSGTKQVSESLTVIERDAVAKTLMGDLVDSLDQSLREAIEQHLAIYITF